MPRRRGPDPLIKTCQRVFKTLHKVQACVGMLPSLMLLTPGCCAWDEMGALFAGVF